MLSNTTPNFNTGRQQRQKSTPDIFADYQNRLDAKHLQHVSHRRGLSLDQRTNMQPILTPTLQQENTLDLTSRGFESYQRHLLQEAQKQQHVARPGQEGLRLQTNEQESQRNIDQTPYLGYGNLAFTDPFISSTPTLNDNDIPQPIDNNFTQIYFEQPPLISNEISEYYEGLDPVSHENSATTACEMETRTNNTPNGGGVVDSNILRPSSQAGSVRPCTPQNPTNSSFFPLTPDTTPFSRVKTIRAPAGRQRSRSPIKDPNLTIKPCRTAKHGSSIEDFFNPTSTETIITLSPPSSERLRPVQSVDLVDFPEVDLMDLSSINMDFLTTPLSYQSSHYSPTSKTISSDNSSFRSSPDMAYLSSFESSPEIKDSPLFRNPFLVKPGEEPNTPGSQRMLEFRSYSPLPKPILHSRSQSISDLDIEATVEDTGISSEEIAAYISGPDPISGRWSCTYPDCNRGFGRKENIKSHVQTHLGDRQYRCIHCGNTFVRQHDLKRHAKIHSGIKPYPCPCGSSFARHDALTRHRQRNTCVGGFEGLCKSPTKRGRPRKIRPDAETRQSKASKTRQRVRAKASSKSPSPTGASKPEDLFQDPPQDLAGDPPEDLPELPPSQPMSRETSASYCSTAPDPDLLLPLSSPLPTFDFDFDLGPMGGLDGPNFGGSTLLNFDEEIGLALAPSEQAKDMISLEMELMGQLEEFIGPLSPLGGEF